MTRVVYTSELQLPFRRLLAPSRVIADLLQHKEVLRAFVKRDFHATYRGTYLGVAWSLLSPLIMLAIFSFVFGGIFHGRFTSNPHETAADFALAMFTGMSLFNCFGQSLGSAPVLILSNSAYVKTLSFPLQMLSVSAVIQAAINMLIALGLCFVIFVALHGHVYVTTIGLIPIAGCVVLLSLACSWVLSAVGVFIRDTPSIVGPITTVLMFLSAVFFPISSVPPVARWLVKLNPLAILVDQGRACLMYDRWPNFIELGTLFVLSVFAALLGYATFMRMKAAFADVI
jgi:homopolymeric O-antigen transport system permease protein